SASRHFHLRSIHCDALCQSFLLAMSGHAGPIQMDLGVTPLVLRISLGQAVALLKGRRARRADLFVSNRASDWNYRQPESRDRRCQPELRESVWFPRHVLLLAPDRMSQLPGLRRN